MEMSVCYTLWHMLLSFWVIPLNTCLTTYDRSSSNVLDLYKVSTDSPGICWHDSPSALHLAGGAKLVPIWHVFRLSFEMLQMKFQTCKELHRQWFFCFQEEVPSFNSHFYLFCPSMKHMTSSTISELGNSTQNFDLLSQKLLSTYERFP
jgi:hypothetical protein